jgi:hypothetical protein
MRFDWIRFDQPSTQHSARSDEAKLIPFHSLAFVSGTFSALLPPEQVLCGGTFPAEDCRTTGTDAYALFCIAMVWYAIVLFSLSSAAELTRRSRLPSAPGRSSLRPVVLLYGRWGRAFWKRPYPRDS